MSASAKKTVDSDDIFTSGRCFQGKFLRLYLKQGIGGHRILFCVAKKIFHNKPQRNRLKRILKAAYARQEEKFDLKNYQIALILCSNRASVSQLQQDLADLSEKAVKP
ncbi:MAG: ribonuclease P protein component [Candidatus Omnitrophota bacterium]